MASTSRSASEIDTCQPPRVIKVAKRKPWREWQGYEGNVSQQTTQTAEPKQLEDGNSPRRSEHIPMWLQPSVTQFGQCIGKQPEEPRASVVEEDKSPSCRNDASFSDSDSCSPSPVPYPTSTPDESECYPIDSIKTEYHPSSNRPTRIEKFEDYLEYDTSTRTSAAKVVNPWHPFNSRVDFEFAELALDACLNERQITALLRIIHKVRSGEDKFNIESYKHLCKTWNQASELLTPFKEISVSGTFGNFEGSYTLMNRSLWDWAMDHVSDPFLAPYFQWDACRMYRFNGKKFSRFIHAPYTADTLWNVQSALPPGGKPFPIIIYSDKTKLSSFSSTMGYPVYARLGNLPEEIRNGRGYAGGRLVGWLPIVDDDLHSDSQNTEYANFKRVIWHTCFRKILEVIKDYSYVGYQKMCGDSIERLLFPFVLADSSDYEEQCMVALIRGYGGLCTCPKCTVEKEKQNNLALKWPLRTAKITKRILMKARNASSEAEAEALLKKHGLRNIDNAFWTVRFSDPHQILSFDHMHYGSDGLGGKHLLPAVKKCLFNLGINTAKTIDTLVSEFPRWRKLNHFEKVMDVNFTDAMKMEDIIKMIPFVAHHILTPIASEDGYQLLLSIRRYLLVDSYLSRDVHSDESIEEGRAELQKFGKVMMTYIEANHTTKTWNFPKLHSFSHAFDDIVAKGSLQAYDSLYNEPLHHSVKRSYQLRTNFKNIERQITSADHCAYVAAHIRNTLDELDRIDKETKDDAKETGTLIPSSNIFNNITLGAPQKKITVRAKLADIEATNPSHMNFYFNFTSKLECFLCAELPSTDADLLQIHATTKLTEFRYIRVSYESKVNGRSTTDYLRCSPEFQNHPRYDCVIVNTDTDPFFGRLLFVFTLKIAGIIYPIGLIRPFERQILRGTASKKDAAFEFYRLRQVKEKETEFIFMRSIIRGAVLVPAYDRPNDFMVFDILDCDMAQRIREYRQ